MKKERKTKACQFSKQETLREIYFRRGLSSHSSFFPEPARGNAALSPKLRPIPVWAGARSPPHGPFLVVS